MKLTVLHIPTCACMVPCTASVPTSGPMTGHVLPCPCMLACKPECSIPCCTCICTARGQLEERS